MPNNSELKRKILSAFKGFIITHKLKPSDIHTVRDRFTARDDVKPKYRGSWRTFSDEKNENFELYYEIKSHSRVLELVERLYSGQTDSDLVTRLMLDTLNEWIVEGKDIDNQHQLKNAGKKFLDSVESAIQPMLLFLPIEGLNFYNDHSLSIGNCTLHNNHGNSDFVKIIEQDRKRYSRDLESGVKSKEEWTERVKSYFTYEVEAHPNRAIERGIEEANLTLNILRLYISSCYFDQKRNMVRQMGLSGSLHFNERSRIFYVNPAKSIEDQFPGGRESRTIYKNIELNEELIEYMKENGLSRINYLVQSLQQNLEGFEGNDVARRLLIAITWFAKATTAKSAADSYLMYAIAIEGLLSKGRTRKETYATQMAALVTCVNEDCLIYPTGGYLSSEFAKQLKEAKSLNDRFDIVRKRILELFSYRNRIAHGAVMDDEVDDAYLLDFETLVQNSILSFVKKEWSIFKDFMDWIKDSVRLDFVPKRKG